MTLSLLTLGFVLGMRHATEADHLAAMATIASRSPSLRSTALQGAAWGMGHTLTLLLVGGAALLLGSTIPDGLASLLELLVGLMLIGLGLDLLYRLHRNRIHFHAHSHADGVRHVHAHAHAPGEPHDAAAHRHDHPERLPRRALLVGLMHGMAGSAALVILAAQTAREPATALLYVLVFGLGSVLGMATLSVVIMLPLRRLQTRGLGRFHRSAQGLIGLATLALGGLVVWENALRLA